MITVNPIPVATASATEQTVALQLVEPLCNAVCASSTILPISQLVFKAGEVKVVGEIAIVPITVSGMISYQQENSCKARPKMFSETFSVGFTATDNNIISLTPSLNVVTELSGISCCNRAHSYTIYTSLAISIA